MDSNHTCLAVISLDYALKKDENFHPQGFLEEFAKLLGLRGNVGYVGCVGYASLSIFYVGQHFTWVIIFTWVAWVKYVFAWVNFFVVCLKNIDWRFGNNILVVHYICIKDMLNQHPISCNSSCTWFWRQYFAYFFHLHYV